MTSLATLLHRGLTEGHDAILIAADGQTVTRAEFRTLVAAARRALWSHGDPRGRRIALHGAVTPPLLACLIAGMIDGAVAVPLDAELAALRKATMIELAQASLVIDFEGSARSLAQGAAVIDASGARWPIDAPIDTATLMPLVGHELSPRVLDDGGPCYVFFTSGTTGTPKGVLGRRGGLAHFIAWEAGMLGVSSGDRVSVLTPLSFDVVLRDILTPIAGGATACIAPRRLAPGAMLDWLDEGAITVSHVVPSLARSFLAAGRPGFAGHTLRHTLFAGEPLTAGLVRRWSEAFPASAIYNLYGPTETTLAKFCARVTGPSEARGEPPEARSARNSEATDGRNTMTGPSEARGEPPEARSARNSEARDGRNTMTGPSEARGEPPEARSARNSEATDGRNTMTGPSEPAGDDVMPCGHPLPGADAIILAWPAGGGGAPGLAPPGEIGEVAIATPHRSLGYLDARQTRERFVRICDRDVYLTGDLGFIAPDGQLHLRGRKDDQIKIRGVRIELAGVAAVIESFEGVGAAAVICVDDGNDRTERSPGRHAGGAVGPEQRSEGRSEDSDRTERSPGRHAGGAVGPEQRSEGRSEDSDRTERSPGRHAGGAVGPEQRSEGRSEDSDRRLVAYVTRARGSASNGTPLAGALRGYLAERLPPAAIPGRFVELAEMPLTANGKLDRARLPAPDLAEASSEPAATDDEQAIAEAFAAALGLPAVGALDDFFALGGNSLGAAAVCAAIQRRLGAYLAPAELLTAATPRALAPRMRGARPPAPISRAPVQRTFALTPQQRRYFRTFCAGGNRSWCNMVAVFALPADTSRAAVEEALADVASCHDSLRLGFAAGDAGAPRQSIDFSWYPRVTEVDLAALATEAARTALDRLRIAEGEQPIAPFGRGPLFRAQLIALAGGERKLLWTVHHLISDGTSQGILGRELIDALTGQRRPEAERLAQPSFVDVAAWAAERPGLAAARDHFRAQFAAPYRHPYLPAQAAQTAVDPQRCLSLERALPAAIRAQLRALARDHRTTPYAVLLAAVFRLMARRTGAADLAIVTPLAGREHPEIAPLIGDFINLVALRVPDIPVRSSAALIGAVKEQVQGAGRHQTFQLDELIDLLGLPFDPDRHPLSGLSLNFMPQSGRAPALPGAVTDKGYKLKYDVLFLVRDYEDATCVELQFRAGLLDGAGALALFDELCAVTEGLS